MSSSSGHRRRQDELSDQLGDRSGFGAAACHPPNSPGGMREWNVAPPVAPFQETKEGAHKRRPSILFLLSCHPARCKRDLVHRFPAADYQGPSERVSDTPLYAPHRIGIAQRHGPGL